MAAQPPGLRVWQQLTECVARTAFGPFRWTYLQNQVYSLLWMPCLWLFVLREAWELEMSELELQAKHSELGPQCFRSSYTGMAAGFSAFLASVIIKTTVTPTSYSDPDSVLSIFPKLIYLTLKMMLWECTLLNPILEIGTLRLTNAIKQSKNM